jgi:hypothetical protein
MNQVKTTADERITPTANIGDLLQSFTDELFTMACRAEQMAECTGYRRLNRVASLLSKIREKLQAEIKAHRKGELDALVAQLGCAPIKRGLNVNDGPLDMPYRRMAPRLVQKHTKKS